MEERSGRSCSAETVRMVLREADFHEQTVRNKPFLTRRNPVYDCNLPNNIEATIWIFGTLLYLPMSAK